jgi:hypothetical protein
MTRVKTGYQPRLQMQVYTHSPTPPRLAHVDKGENKNMGNVLQPTRKGENYRDIASMLKSLDAECRNCAPISPL